MPETTHPSSAPPDKSEGPGVSGADLAVFTRWILCRLFEEAIPSDTDTRFQKLAVGLSDILLEFQEKLSAVKTATLDVRADLARVQSNLTEMARTLAEQSQTLMSQTSQLVVLGSEKSRLETQLEQKTQDNSKLQEHFATEAAKVAELTLQLRESKKNLDELRKPSAILHTMLNQHISSLSVLKGTWERKLASRDPALALPGGGGLSIAAAQRVLWQQERSAAAVNRRLLLLQSQLRSTTIIPQAQLRTLTEENESLRQKQRTFMQENRLLQIAQSEVQQKEAALCDCKENLAECEQWLLAGKLLLVVLLIVLLGLGVHWFS